MAKFTLAALILILLLAFSIRVYNLNYNSPFFDEAQYIVLGKKILTLQKNGFVAMSWVGGFPYFYPPLAAIFGSFGIVGARFLSVILGTFSVFLIYLFSKDLLLAKQNNSQNTWVGLLAGAFLAIMAIPIYLSRLAIYDMLSFTLLLASLVLLIKALNNQKSNFNLSKKQLLASSFVFFLSFLAKYTTLIFLPFMVLWSFLLNHLERNSRPTFLISLFLLPVSLLIILYVVLNFENLYSFYTNQISDADNRSVYAEIISQYFEYNLPILLLASFGSLALVLTKQQSKVLILLCFSLVTLVVHIATNNLRTFHQHTFLIIIFLLPLAAYFPVWVSGKSKIFAVTVTLVFLTILFAYSRFQINLLETSWTNTSEVHNFIRENIQPGQKVLSFEDDVTILALDNLDPANIAGIYNFEYHDLLGDDTYSQALKDGYFDFVLINGDVEGSTADTIKQEVMNNYQQVYNKSSFQVYKRN